MIEEGRGRGRAVSEAARQRLRGEARGGEGDAPSTVQGRGGKHEQLTGPRAPPPPCSVSSCHSHLFYMHIFLFTQIILAPTGLALYPDPLAGL